MGEQIKEKKFRLSKHVGQRLVGSLPCPSFLSNYCVIRDFTEVEELCIRFEGQLVLVDPVLYTELAYLVFFLPTNVVEDDDKLGMIRDVSVDVEAVQGEEHVVHTFDRGLSDTIRLIWHDALDERSDPLVRVSHDWPHRVDKLDQDIFVRSSDV